MNMPSLFRAISEGKKIRHIQWPSDRWAQIDGCGTKWKTSDNEEDFWPSFYKWHDWKLYEEPRRFTCSEVEEKLKRYILPDTAARVARILFAT